MTHTRKWRKLVRLGALALWAVLAVNLLAPFTATAAERIDLWASASLTVINQQREEPIPDVEFRLYRVADVTEDLTFIMNADFSQSGVSMDTSEERESWAARATTLESYVVERMAEEQPISPTAIGTTDETGTLQFLNLTPGMYLLVGERTTVGNTIHHPQATLIALPNQDTAGNLQYHPTIYTKNSSRTLRDEPIDLSVVKIWKDTGEEEQRPEEIQVTLFQSETEFETVTLSPENNWRYTWEGLDSMADWYLTERDVPAEYTVTVEEENAVFVVTNTYQEETPVTPTPTITPVSSAPTTPTVSTTPTVPTKLPQTGQLWWPMSLLSVAGLTLILAGWGIRRREYADEA